MNVILGIGGGIAAYKSAEIARLLVQRDVKVRVVMTRAARKFISPLTFATLTGQKVITNLFPASSEETLASSVEHIAVARENETLLVAPATAGVLARFAHGIANDFLTTTYLAFTGRVVLAPAMNKEMWAHPATQANMMILRERGHSIVEPESGYLACGEIGAGRLADPEQIVEAVLSTPRTQDLDGEHVLITAGPTQEAIDPVRFISNRSSGKMGFALAEAAASRGASVTLITGPVHLPTPKAVTRIDVRSAEQMRKAVFDHLEPATVIVKSAAVADFRPANASTQKIKKTAMRLSLELDPTPDILNELGRKKGDRLLIGFAAETERLEEEARRKLESKNCDMIVANKVGGPGTGFESDDNEVLLVVRSGPSVPLRRAPKREIADRILDQILTLRIEAAAAR
ncbi:MAG TPA: bifunctional phosphopantothenoylcysteine decarboxylase/phosphopantothenate--cysteine ligase CoaBC [Bryobacteraceae bacterium]|jgi:phosphopantothenoylcysteine decarboxylase/phosphopantothenate--cysteine ligase